MANLEIHQIQSHKLDTSENKAIVITMRIVAEHIAKEAEYSIPIHDFLYDFVYVCVDRTIATRR